MLLQMHVLLQTFSPPYSPFLIIFNRLSSVNYSTYVPQHIFLSFPHFLSFFFSFSLALISLLFPYFLSLLLHLYLYLSLYLSSSDSQSHFLILPYLTFPIGVFRYHRSWQHRELSSTKDYKKEASE